jgi:hypothetical protein
VLKTICSNIRSSAPEDGHNDARNMNFTVAVSHQNLSLTPLFTCLPLAHLATSWHTLPKIWHALAHLSTPWHTLQHFCTPRHTFTSAQHCTPWHTLAYFVISRHILAQLDTPWHILAHLDTPWHALAHLSTHWHTLEHFSTPSIR